MCVYYVCVYIALCMHASVYTMYACMCLLCTCMHYVCILCMYVFVYYVYDCMCVYYVCMYMCVLCMHACVYMHVCIPGHKRMYSFNLRRFGETNNEHSTFFALIN